MFSPRNISGHFAGNETDTGVETEISSDFEDENTQNIDEQNNTKSDELTNEQSGVTSPQNSNSHEQDKPSLFETSNEHKIILKKGDTLASVLGKLGFDKTDIHLLSRSLSKIYNLKNLKSGQEITVLGKRNENGKLALNGIEIQPNYKFRISVIRTGSGFQAKKIDIPIKKVIRSISGKMQPNSPVYSLKKCGVKPQISAEALRSLGQLADIKNSKSPVDFEFLYYDFYDGDGNVVRKPELIYASVLVNGKIKRVYRFADGNSIEYVDSNGTIIKTTGKEKSLLQPPLSQMKVNSGFGMRRHPISGQMRWHTGIDLAAKIGTPIRAAAGGIVKKAAFYSGYGRYVSVQHTDTIGTAYAHLSRIAVRNGQHVYQGQIIGYVGHSGYSSGPHLHYEVLVNGSPINPTRFVKQEPQKLIGCKLTKFNQFKKEVNLQVVGLVQQSKNRTAKAREMTSVH
jgi:murein DD-endopeptidase MepM/ murein hydrolase activator NlpD